LCPIIALLFSFGLPLAVRKRAVLFHMTSNDGLFSATSVSLYVEVGGIGIGRIVDFSLTVFPPAVRSVSYFSLNNTGKYDMISPTFASLAQRRYLLQFINEIDYSIKFNAQRLEDKMPLAGRRHQVMA
jgi:hypothetical protein